MYDIYSIVYHTLKRNYRALLCTLKNLTFIYSPSTEDTIQFIMWFMEDETDTRLRCVMIYILYIYIEHVFDLFIADESNIEYINRLINKHHEFAHDIMNIPSLPKYIKSFICVRIVMATSYIRQRATMAYALVL